MPPARLKSELYEVKDATVAVNPQAARHRLSDCCSWGLEGECKKCRPGEEQECHDVVPRELLLQVQHRERYEDQECHHLLDDLELKPGELDIAESIRRYRQAVFQQSDKPGHHDRLPQRPVVTVFEVAVPGYGHENVGAGQQQDGSHG